MKVTINGITREAAAGCLLSELILPGELELPCGGDGRCGKCRVTAHGALSEPSEREKHLLGNAIHSGCRLACMTRAEGDCTVVTESADAVVCTDGARRIDLSSPAFTQFGAAVDIGTTTLAARLFDRDGRCIAEAGAKNPQSAFGADVISRIEAALAGKGRALAGCIREAVSRLLVKMADAAGILPEEIDAVVITGNTTMLHLLTETSPAALARAPFKAERLFGETIPAVELSLPTTGEVYLPPCIAAFLGADTVTAALASGFFDGDTRTRLLADIGTNGELLLSHGGKLYACSTAAGPAFEGAGISMGMGGRPGAIDHVTVSDGTLHAHVIGDVPPTGICGSGIVDAAACLLELEILDETGFLEDGDAQIAPPVMLTQEDIRKIQLAKSAIHAGIRTLLHTAGASADGTAELVIAGGFGSYLDPENAGRIGLFPPELSSRANAVGNGALTGAAMLLDTGRRPACAKFCRRVQVSELAANPVFIREYTEQMLF
ncbi:MAG: DUF4445 domain-containing protein [Ruminococcaceae bacterium]|nr:DUF4445 domain-containing protein [Oscillospiraceae bacterium]